MPSGYITWKRAAVAIAVLFAISVIVSSFADFGSEEFTDKEKAVLRVLEPQLDTLLVLEREVPPGLGGFYDCTTGDSNTAVDFDTDSRDDGTIDVRRAAVVDDEDGTRADRQLCGEDGISWIAMVVSPQTSKDDQVHDLRVETELSRRKKEDLQSVVTPLAKWTADSEEVLSIDWVGIDGLGNAGWGYVVEVRYPDGSEALIYDFDFTRDVVSAGLTVRLQAQMSSQEHAISIARAFDNKIKARLDSISAAGRAQ